MVTCNREIIKTIESENIDEVKESVINFDKYEHDLGGYANELGEQLSEFLSKADVLVNDSVISEEELKLLMDASDLLKEINPLFIRYDKKVIEDEKNKLKMNKNS